MLKIRNLRTPKLAIDTLDVAAGECVAITGASGAGKSLLLRAIADLDPNEGDVSLSSTDRAALSADKWRSLVALVPTESGWWADRVSDHFFVSNGAAALIEALGLPSDALSWSVARLSSGERQRLALARALILNPKALLLDEPTASLDATATQLVEALLQQRLDDGLPIVLVTHDPEQAQRLARTTVQLSEGRIAERAGSAS
jgi:ABC-type iron transport system FetAB ATPase subunit